MAKSKQRNSLRSTSTSTTHLPLLLLLHLVLLQSVASYDQSEIYGVHLTLNYDPQKLTLVWLTRSQHMFNNNNSNNNNNRANPCLQFHLGVAYGFDEKQQNCVQNISSSFLRMEKDFR